MFFFIYNEAYVLKIYRAQTNYTIDLKIYLEITETIIITLQNFKII